MMNGQYPEHAMLSDWLGKSMTAGIRVVSAYVGSRPVDEIFSDAKLEALVRHHPGKRVDSPTSFTLSARPPYFTKALYVNGVDFSLRKCVANFFGKHNKERTVRHRALNALRNEAFRSEKMQAARKTLGNKCAECGNGCRKLVVDHTGKSFMQIADEFVRGKGTTVSALGVRYAKGTYHLLSGGKSWRDFHDAQAELVGVCAGCNLRLGSRGYRSKSLISQGVIIKG